MPHNTEILSLLIWSSDEIRIDTLRGKGSATPPTLDQPKKKPQLTRGCGVLNNIPVFGINAEGHTEDHEGLVLFESADQEHIKDTADAAERFAQ